MESSKVTDEVVDRGTPVRRDMSRCPGYSAIQTRIVLVSLERAHVRRRQMAARFERVGLDYEVWPAVDARSLTEAQRRHADQAGRRRNGLHSIPSGSLANTLSHRALMEDFVKRGPEVMAVFEDDARFDAALPRVLSTLARMSDAFDIVKLQRRNLHRRFIPSVQLGLDKSLQDNITMAYYQAGHMMYIDQGELAKMKRDLDAYLDNVLSGE